MGPHTARPVVSPPPAPVALAPLHVGWEPGVAGQPGALKAPQGWRSPAGAPNIVESNPDPSCPQGSPGVGAGAGGGAPTWSLWPARAGAWSKETCPARAARRSPSPSRMCGFAPGCWFPERAAGSPPSSTEDIHPDSSLGSEAHLSPGAAIARWLQARAWCRGTWTRDPAPWRSGNHRPPGALMAQRVKNPPAAQEL